MAALFFDRLTHSNAQEWSLLMSGKKYPQTELKSTMRKILGELESWISEVEVEDGKAGISEQATEHSALNLVVSDGCSMLAIRYASPQPHEPPSLYYSTTAGATLNRKYKGHPDSGHPELAKKGIQVQQGERNQEEHGKHVIVASEPSTYEGDDWTLIGVNQLVSVDDKDMKPVVEDI